MTAILESQQIIALYNSLQPDKPMAKWMVLDPVPVFENNQITGGLDLQKEVFRSDSALILWGAQSY